MRSFKVSNMRFVSGEGHPDSKKQNVLGSLCIGMNHYVVVQHHFCGRLWLCSVSL